MSAKVKVWITKYALTQGILEVSAEITKGDTGVEYASCGGLFTREFARSEVEALDIAEGMRRRRIASLEKQLAKLRKMDSYRVKPWSSR